MAKLFHALMKERKSFNSVWHKCSPQVSADFSRQRTLWSPYQDSIIYHIWSHGEYCGVRLVHCKIKKLTNLKNVNINYKTTKLQHGYHERFILNLYKEQRLNNYTIKKYCEYCFVDKLKQLDILCNSGHKHMAMAESSRPGITPDFSLH